MTEKPDLSGFFMWLLTLYITDDILEDLLKLQGNSRRKGNLVMKDDAKKKLIDELFKDYDLSAEYPFEIVDKGGAVGEELY